VLIREEAVRDQARNFLVDLYLHCKVSDKQKREITEQFLETLDAFFGQLCKQASQHWLTIISTFIRRFDFEHMQELPLTSFDKNFI